MSIQSQVMSLLLVDQLLGQSICTRRMKAVATSAETVAKSFDRYRERVKETLGWDCDSIVIFSPDQIELVD
jgi:hypothetical protein